MALKPGESTTLQMTFTMHEGMGGPHDFRVHIPNNDPDWGDRTLTVLSDWVE
jgi:hypothetical protein